MGGGESGRAQDYEPSTFLERGTVVPFTTRSLSQCRVRLDERERLEVLLPGFSGARSLYVAPWSALPTLVSMTVHDRALTEAVADAGGVTPADIRRCWLTLATSGIGGQALARRAMQDLAHEERTRISARVFLLLDIVSATGGAVGPDIIATLDTPLGEQRLRAALSGAGRQLKLPIEEVDRIIESLADMMADLGLKAVPDPGRLRALHWRMGEFEHAISNWARTTVADIAPMARFAAKSAAHSIEIARISIDRVDKALSRPLRLLADWSEQQKMLRTELVRIAWLLDGWDYVIEQWDAATSGAVPIDVAVAEIGRIVPIVPVKECPRDTETRAGDLQKEYRSRVKMFEDWLTGTVDIALEERVRAAARKDRR